MNTKQTFNQTANTISRQVYKAREMGDTISLSTLESLARDFARQYADDNPRFDPQRFIAACGF